MRPHFLFPSTKRPQFLFPPHTGEVDMWSLGAIVFTLLGAYSPFDPWGNASEAVLRKRVIAVEWGFDHFPEQWRTVSEEVCPLAPGQGPDARPPCLRRRSQRQLSHCLRCAGACHVASDVRA
jgi:serine/threonine protein kinase